jgi:protein SCO1/2
MRLSFFCLAFAAAFLGAAGCRDRAAPTSTWEATPTLSASVAEPAPGASLYPLDVSLRDQDGADIKVDLFRGQPVIISMFFGTCPAACPLLVTNIKRMEASLTPEARAELRVLLVSFDAERDTPDRLRELARDHKVDPARWRFASATDEQARVLGNALGISFRRIENGMFAHDSVISVLDRDGRVVARADDLSADLGPLERTVAHLGLRHE